MNVFDVHCHVPITADDQRLFRVPERADFASWISSSPKPAARDIGAAVQPASYYVLTGGIEDTRRHNDLVRTIAESTNSTSQTAVLPIGTVEPHHGDASLDEIDRLSSDGFAGVAWRARSQGVFGDIPLMATFIARAAERALVPLLHAGPRSGNEALWRIWHLAEQFPSVPIIVLGALSGWDHQQAILAQPDRAANVLYDLSGLFGDPRQITALADRLGLERLVFGSGTHCDGPLDAHRFAQTIVDGPIADAVKQAVLWDNAARLFDLTAVAR